MPDQHKVEYIIELLKQGSFDGARKEFESLDTQAKKTGTSLKAFALSAKGAIVAVASSALLRQGINEFIQMERAVAKLNTTLKSTGQFGVGYSKQLQALAESLGKVTAFEDDEITNVIAKLIALGATKQQIAPLTETVLNLATLFDRDLNRAVLTVGQVMRGEFSAIEAMGLKFQGAEGHVEKYNKAMEFMTNLARGQAREALSGLSGEVERGKKLWKEFLELIGKWGAIAFAAVADQARGTEAAFKAAHTARRAQLEKEIDLLVEQKKLAADVAALMKGDLAKAFEGETRTETFRIGGGMAGGMGKRTVTVRDPEREKAALDSIAGALPRTPTAGAGEAPGDLRRRDAEEWLAMVAQIHAEEMKAERELQEEQAKTMDERTRAAMQAHEEQKRVAEMEMQLQNELTLVGLEGIELEMEQSRINHEERIRQIQQLKFEDVDRYNNLIAAENQLYGKQQRRINDAHSASFRFEQNMIRLGQRSQEAFASGLAGAIIDAAKGADDAWSKFFENFIEMILQAILEALILKLVMSFVTGLGGGLFGKGGQAATGGGGLAGGYDLAGGSVAASGGQFGLNKMALGGMILAAKGVHGVANISRPTFFPRFNVLAGEAGPEVMTVMANPHLGRFNGEAAQLGTIKGRDMAILPKSALDRAAPGGGVVDIRVTLGPELRAEIIEESIEGARVQVTQDMSSNTALAQTTKRLVQ